MTTAQLAVRLEALEKAVEQLEAKLSRPADPKRAWWREDAGRFKDDPVFDEIVRLGREYRESLRPKRSRRKRVNP
jgi:hypothetical protein